MKIINNIRAKKQDRQAQKLFDDVTKSLQSDWEAQREAQRIISGIPNDEPLHPEWPIAKTYIALTAPIGTVGKGIAKGLEFIGEKMMPSAFLKGFGQVFPKLAKVTKASPYLDAGLLSYWGAQGLREAKQAAQNGDVPGAIAGVSMAALPLMGIRPNLAQELTRTQKANEIARALNREVRSTQFADTPLTQNILAGKIGWAPKQTATLWHNSEQPLTKLSASYPSWDVVERSAPIGHSWMTGSETTRGFLAQRPFHLKSKVTLEKPMVQLNEAIGNGKNAVRNEILDFAQQSSADGINFSNIADNTLQNQNVYAIFKDINFKQGGTLKAQKGKALKLISKIKLPTHTNNFSGVENLSKEAIGFGGVRPNLGLQMKQTENRSKELIKIFDEFAKKSSLEARREAFMQERFGKSWNDLSELEQYWTDIRFRDKWK